MPTKLPDRKVHRKFPWLNTITLVLGFGCILYAANELFPSFVIWQATKHSISFLTIIILMKKELVVAIGLEGFVLLGFLLRQILKS